MGTQGNATADRLAAEIRSLDADAAVAYLAGVVGRLIVAEDFNDADVETLLTREGDD